LVDSNPQIRQMLQNPEMMQMMMNPQVMQQAMQMMGGGGMGNLGGGGFGGGQLGGFGGMNFGQGGQSGQSTSSTSNVDPKELYKDQLAKLKDMGFTNEEVNLDILKKVGGNVDAAVERLLSLLG